MTDVLITGASRGIGLALTREYLSRGARVFAAVRDPARAGALRDLTTDQLVIVAMDVRSSRDIDAAGATVARHDGLDVVVNNAGTHHRTATLADVDCVRMRDVLDVNTVGPVLVAQRFIPLLRSGGRLVNLTAPTRPITDLSRSQDHAFIASRYALNAVTKMVATELAGTGRTVVAMWPGYLRTDLNDHAEAATPLEDAIPGVVDLIERLGPADHGACVMPDGTHYPW